MSYSKAFKFLRNSADLIVSFLAEKTQRGLLINNKEHGVWLFTDLDKYGFGHGYNFSNKHSYLTFQYGKLNGRVKMVNRDNFSLQIIGNYRNNRRIGVWRSANKTYNTNEKITYFITYDGKGNCKEQHSERKFTDLRKKGKFNIEVIKYAIADVISDDTDGVSKIYGFDENSSEKNPIMSEEITMVHGFHHKKINYNIKTGKVRKVMKMLYSSDIRSKNHEISDAFPREISTIYYAGDGEQIKEEIQIDGQILNYKRRRKISKSTTIINNSYGLTVTGNVGIGAYCRSFHAHFDESVGIGISNAVYATRTNGI